MDTIAAIATGSGLAGIGIIRISGSQSKSIAQIITRKTIPNPRIASYRKFYEFSPNHEAKNSSLIDSGILIYFCAPNSYTGEDLVEMQIHGSPILLSMLLQACINAGAILAPAGEFTKRAFLNGKIDLAQAEAVVDIIYAASKSAAIGAAASLQGEFSDRVNVIASLIIEVRSLIELGLDFSDQDLDQIDYSNLFSQIKQIDNELSQLSIQTNNGRLLSEGVKVAIIGEVNVGKSSILNTLMGEDLAIVTDIPGTTRDPIDQRLLIEGIPFEIIDTAGIRTTDHPIEKIGISRTANAIEEADIILYVQCFDQNGRINIEDSKVQSIFTKIQNNQYNSDKNPKRIINLINKCDLVKTEINDHQDSLIISTKEKIGLEELKKAIVANSGFNQKNQTEQSVFIARSRHLAAIIESKEHITQAQAYLENQRTPDELIAEELRLAHSALQKITGQFASDDLLGEIFSKFCIGK